MKQVIPGVILILLLSYKGYSTSRISDLLYTNPGQATDNQLKKKQPPDFLEDREGDEYLKAESLERAFHPNYEYKYFQDSHNHPFRPSRIHYDPVNAWWLAEASFAAYTEGEFLTRALKEAGFEEVRFFRGELTDSQGFVASNSGWILVAFRGTEPTKLKDFITDSDFFLDDSGQGGKVHSGFLEAFLELWNTAGLSSYLNTLLAKNPRPLWFTGHSLGGAIATLAADRHQAATGLYTFGSPRVGNWAFKRDFKVPYFRFVHNLDLITHLPPMIPIISPYMHVGKARRISALGELISTVVKLHKAKNQTNESWRKRIADKFRGSLRYLFDHAPEYYAIHTWNHYLDVLGGADLPEDSDQVRPDL